MEERSYLLKLELGFCMYFEVLLHIQTFEFPLRSTFRLMGRYWVEPPLRETLFVQSYELPFTNALLRQVLESLDGINTPNGFTKKAWKSVLALLCEEVSRKLPVV